ncbi:MAG: hypothetical protein C0602_11745 [Denitrovibrio sp.]|nr:MAG: hypothetical protein C0602_11745 [Denitrovibrio sp.]
MFFTGSLICANILSLILAVVLSWYFGGHDFRMHPDRLIASFISYSEKSVYREGSFKEGVIALSLNLAFVFGVSALLFYFIKNAGILWYFTFSTLVIYWLINPRFTKSKSDSNIAINYMNYALPVIVFSFLFGPVGALLYRTIPLTAHMNPVTIDKYSEFGEPAEKTFTVLSDAALLLVPLIIYLSSAMRRLIKYIKSLRP